MIRSRRLFGVSFILAMAVSILILSILSDHPAAMFTVTSIKGRVVEKDTGQPISYCNVLLAGAAMGSIAKPDGSFKFDGIPPGAYTLKAIMMGYETESICRIEIEEGETLFFPLELEPREKWMETEIIIGPCGPDEGWGGCALHHVKYEELVWIELPVIDTAIFWDEGYEKARAELFPNGDPFIIDKCLSQSTDSSLALRCSECVGQARIWLGERK